MTDKRFFLTEQLAPVDTHKFALGLIVPRPIGWIGSRDRDGTRNLAPFSFFNAVSGYPPTVMFSPGLRNGGPKDTLANVESTGVFTCSIVSADLGEQMNQTAATAAADVDEFELAGLTAVDGSVVDAPMVAESKANLECRVTQIVRTGRAPTEGSVVFGEVVAYHVDPALLDGTRIDQVVLDAIGRMGGPRYTHTRSIFSLERPD